MQSKYNPNPFLSPKMSHSFCETSFATVRAKAAKMCVDAQSYHTLHYYDAVIVLWILINC